MNMKKAFAVSALAACAALRTSADVRAGGAAPVVAETLLADGTTNTWTQADLVDALGLLNRRYRRDVETEAGRRAWHGRRVSQSLSTNEAGLLVMTSRYEDGFEWAAEGRAPAPKEAARAALNARALLATNGVSPRLAARRLATASAPLTVEAAVRVDATPPRLPIYDAYGVVTNFAPAAQGGAR